MTGLLKIRNKKMVILFLAIFFIAVDRVLKNLALKIWLERPWPLTDFFGLSGELNRGAALSLPLTGKLLTALIVILIIGLAIYTARLWRSKRPRAALWLTILIIGAASNLYDRWRWGGVIDYLEVKYFTVFNLADVLIVISVGALLWRELRKSKTTTPPDAGHRLAP